MTTVTVWRRPLRSALAVTVLGLGLISCALLSFGSPLLGTILSSTGEQPPSVPQVQPLALHPENQRYFLFRGQPTVLITSGEHYGAVINRDFDYDAYLDELQANGFNLTRLFAGSFVAFPGAPGLEGLVGASLGPERDRFLAPWARSSQPGYGHGGAKFDLNTWDPAYFSRLKDFVAKAGERGVVVEVTLFSNMYNQPVWDASPLNARNNVNGVGGGLAWDQVHSVRNTNLLAAQSAMVKKIVTELNEFDNVYYEILNENGAPRDWEDAMTAAVVEAEASLPHKHLIAYNIHTGSTNVPSIEQLKPNPAWSVYNFHFASGGIVRANHASNRPVAWDEDGAWNHAPSGYRMDAWEFMLAGGAAYNHLDWSFDTRDERGTQTIRGSGPALRSQFRVLKDFLNSFDFVRMHPDPSVLRDGVPGRAEALVDPGRAYAVYLRGGTRASLSIDLPPGTYRSEWIDTKSGAREKVEEFAHAGGVRGLQSPDYVEDIALSVRASG